MGVLRARRRQSGDFLLPAREQEDSRELSLASVLSGEPIFALAGVPWNFLPSSRPGTSLPHLETLKGGSRASEMGRAEEGSSPSLLPGQASVALWDSLFVGDHGQPTPLPFTIGEDLEGRAGEGGPFGFHRLPA